MRRGWKITIAAVAVLGVLTAREAFYDMGEAMDKSTTDFIAINDAANQRHSATVANELDKLSPEEIRILHDLMEKDQATK